MTHFHPLKVVLCYVDYFVYSNVYNIVYNNVDNSICLPGICLTYLAYWHVSVGTLNKNYCIVLYWQCFVRGPCPV